MMTVLTGYVRQWHRRFRKGIQDPTVRDPVQLAGCFLLGLVLSAASLSNQCQVFPLGVLCAGLPGWLPLPFCLGGCLGYWLFWGPAGIQGIVWLALGLPVGVLLGSRKQVGPLLQPALAAMIVSVCGVVFQMWRGDDTSIAMYLLRVGLGFGSAWLAMQLPQRREGPAEWAAAAVLVLALCQLAPIGLLNLGVLTAAMLLPTVSFPAAAMLGLAIDLSQVTPVPMTAVLCLSCLLRLIPLRTRVWQRFLPALTFIPVMALSGRLDLLPLPALMLGCLGSFLLQEEKIALPHRGETGAAQVRLEMTAGVLSQTQQMLLETDQSPIDEGAVLEKAMQRACSSCPCRKGCKQPTLPRELLQRNLTGVDDLPADCRKRGRLLTELRRGQEGMRILRADRMRQQEYRSALVQQLQFLSEYLQDLADRLPRQNKERFQRFRPEVAVCSAGRERANGDRCQWFAGVDGVYYLMLCDGMGTGIGAAQEAKTAADLLRQLLTAGFPAGYALRSLNSLCTLRDRPGAVTVDLAELHLDSGKVTLYKWGAAPSYLLTRQGAQCIGRASPPPGISVEGKPEVYDKLSLQRGQSLILLSDGVDAQAATAGMEAWAAESPGSLAARLLEQGKGDGSDDATAAAVRLLPLI